MGHHEADAIESALPAHGDIGLQSSSGAWRSAPGEDRLHAWSGFEYGSHASGTASRRDERRPLELLARHTRGPRADDRARP